MSRLSNQHSWHQTPEQKPNMTFSSLDVTQDAEMIKALDGCMLEILVPTCVSVLMFYQAMMYFCKIIVITPSQSAKLGSTWACRTEISVEVMLKQPWHAKQAACQH